MKNIFWYIIILLLVTACQSQESTSSVVQEVANPVEVELFNYRTGDGDPGWRIGRATIYYLNTSDAVVQSKDITIYSAELAIQEDSEQTYPITLHEYPGGLEDYSASPFAMNRGIRDLDYPVVVQTGDGKPLDPGVPISTELVLHLQFAEIATPTSITLKTSIGDIVYPIGSIPQSLPRPNNVNLLPLSEFSDRNNVDNEQVRLVFSKRCQRDGGTFYITYTLENKDLFNELVFGPYGTFSVISDDGTEFSLGDDVANLVHKTTLGPGQKISGEFTFDHFVARVGEGPQPEFLVVLENGQRILYEINCQ